ncbi:MAG: hypothetical protein QOE14_1615, partial [Humisphaera sp.]|nr:hypothetical protein [Humisphaera sp.]
MVRGGACSVTGCGSLVVVDDDEPDPDPP